jgi:hypothetical protein
MSVSSALSASEVGLVLGIVAFGLVLAMFIMNILVEIFYTLRTVPRRSPEVLVFGAFILIYEALQRKPEKLRSFRSRSIAISNVEFAARGIDRGFSRTLVARGLAGDKEISERFAKVLAAVRAYQRDLALFKPEMMSALSDRAAHFAYCVCAGALGDLPVMESAEAEKQDKRSLSSSARAITVAVAPLLLTFVLHGSGMLDGQFLYALTAGSAVWLLACLTFGLDPSAAAKLRAIREVARTFRPFGKD